MAVGAWREGNAPATIDFGAAYVFSRTGLAWNAIGVRLPSAITNDRAGTAVALNDAGTRLAVGAPGDTLGGGATTGKVYVYTLSGTWTADPGSPLTPSNGDNGDVFGASVALDSSGDTLLVGAWLEDGSGTYIDPADDDLALQAGAAYRFERSATPTWDETEYIKATNTAAGDEFGSVAISDDGLHILMGASGEDSNATGVDGNQDNRDGTTNDSGAAYFYDL